MTRAEYGSLGVCERTCKEYRAWQNMRNRCGNPKYYLYHQYGGRGIKVCSRWDSYKNFIDDMGRAPTSKHSIDRISNDGNYEPSNCRWADAITQSNNRSNNNYIEYNGKWQSLAGWCKELNLDYGAVNRRIQLGWDSAKAFEHPIGSTTFKYITPDGEFSDQYQVAEYYGIKLKTVSARFCSETKTSWVKVKL